LEWKGVCSLRGMMGGIRRRVRGEGRLRSGALLKATKQEEG